MHFKGINTQGIWVKGILKFYTFGGAFLKSKIISK